MWLKTNFSCVSFSFYSHAFNFSGIISFCSSAFCARCLVSKMHNIMRINAFEIANTTDSYCMCAKHSKNKYDNHKTYFHFYFIFKKYKIILTILIGIPRPLRNWVTLLNVLSFACIFFVCDT